MIPRQPESQMFRKDGKWALQVSRPSSILKPKVVNVLSYEKKGIAG